MAKDTEEPKDRSHELHDDTLDIARTTLTGDLRDVILDQLKHNHDALPWHMRGELAQQMIINNVTSRVERAVEKAVRIMAADGRKVVMAQLDQVTVKDGIKATLMVSKSSEQRHDLMDAVGYDVLLVVSDADAYKGQRRGVYPDPDQKPLFDQTDAGRDDGEIPDAAE